MFTPTRLGALCIVVGSAEARAWGSAVMCCCGLLCALPLCPTTCLSLSLISLSHSLCHEFAPALCLCLCLPPFPPPFSPVQVIGVVVAETEPLARRAAKAVKVTYEDLPAIISIEDAIEANSYYEQYHGDSLVSGDLQAGFEGECVWFFTPQWRLGM